MFVVILYFKNTSAVKKNTRNPVNNYNTWNPVNNHNT